MCCVRCVSSHAGGGECDKPCKRIHVVIDTEGEFGGDQHDDRPLKAKPFIVRVHFQEELDVVLNQLELEVDVLEPLLQLELLL